MSGTARVVHYRLYTLTPGVCLPIRPVDIYAEDDGEAVQLARLRLEHADMELWCGTRKVALVPKDGLAIILSQVTSASSVSSDNPQAA